MIFNKKNKTTLTRYWYIDTVVEGGVAKVFVIDGELEKIDKFNKSIGNFFENKKDAEKALKHLKELNKKKK